MRNAVLGISIEVASSEPQGHARRYDKYFDILHIEYFLIDD